MDTRSGYFSLFHKVFLLFFPEDYDSQPLPPPEKKRIHIILWQKTGIVIMIWLFLSLSFTELTIWFSICCQAIIIIPVFFFSCHNSFIKSLDYTSRGEGKKMYIMLNPLRSLTSTVKTWSLGGGRFSRNYKMKKIGMWIEYGRRDGGSRDIYL